MTWDDRSRQPPRDVACTSSFAGTCIRNTATGFPWLRPPIAESKIDQWIPWCWVTQTVILAERVTCLICELHAITPWACTCDVMMWNCVELCSKGDNKYTMADKQTLIFHVNFKIWFSYWCSSTWYIFLEYIYFFFSDREIWKTSVYLTGLQKCLVRHEGLYAEYLYNFPVTHPDLSLPWSMWETQKAYVGEQFYSCKQPLTRVHKKLFVEAESLPSLYSGCLCQPGAYKASF